MAQPLSHRLVAASVVAVVAGMAGMAYAAVPLYKMFCAATGYNGTTQVAKAAAAAEGMRTLNVRFDSNVGPGLNWTFEPEVNSLEVRTGKTITAFYKVTSHSRDVTTAIARYNVTPDAAGTWFDKISCFCFSEVTLNPGESIDLPVVFFLDLGLEKDQLMQNIEGITLSYTFYPATPAPLASNGEALKKL